MMKYFLFLIALIPNFLTAQTLSFPDAAFKTKLLQSDPNTAIARNLSDDYFAIDADKNGEIELSEAMQVTYLNLDDSSISSLVGLENFTNLVTLQCSNNQISTLNVGGLQSLIDLNCSNNLLKTLTVTGAIQLQNLYCQSNQLTTLDANDLPNLFVLDCSDNTLSSLNLTNLNSLQSLVCNTNALSSLNLTDLVGLLTLDCDRNMIHSLDFSMITNVTNLQCNFNQLSSLDLSTLVNLSSVECTDNQLANLKIDGLTKLSSLNCNNNVLTGLQINTLTSLTYVHCNNNNLSSLQVTGLLNLRVLDFSKNQITSLYINELKNLQNLYCSNNKLVDLDATEQTGLQSLDISNNLLTHLYIKNGSNESYGYLLLSGNPNLTYICADESEIEYVQDQILNNGYTNCFVNSYCSFVPGGNYYTVEGSSKLDSNSTGCDALDSNFPNLKLTTTDDATTTTFIADSSGNTSFGVKEGAYTVSPELENPSYYTVSPASTSVTFPNATSPFLAHFCISPNGSHSDLEISLLPLDDSRSNFESNYIIVYKNKGTLSSSGSINLTFDANALLLIKANPTVSSQNLGILNWNFTNLQPQETRTILVTLKVKSSISSGYLLKYNTTITNSTDETPKDNSSDLNEVVVNSVNSNDKICLEGALISQTKVGDYLHYRIRFENSGSSIAKNIVVKDLIDPSKFDISTLVPINASHPFVTKIANNTAVEFIFQNINLPFDTSSNEGYVAFKIKTKPALSIGDELLNSATIYFDYNQPLTTNTAKTSIQVLQIQDQVLLESFLIYPNPVKNTLNIVQKSPMEMRSLTIYNALGQLVQTFIKAENDTTAIDVSQLKAGLYFIKIKSDKGSFISKILKE